MPTTTTSPQPMTGPTVALVAGQDPIALSRLQASEHSRIVVSYIEDGREGRICDLGDSDSALRTLFGILMEDAPIGLVPRTRPAVDALAWATLMHECYQKVSEKAAA